MTVPVQTLMLGNVQVVVETLSDAPPPAIPPQWFVDYLKSRRRALMQELREIEKTLVNAGELPPEVLRR
jgi:hypothetical protein